MLGDDRLVQSIDPGRLAAFMTQHLHRNSAAPPLGCTQTKEQLFFEADVKHQELSRQTNGCMQQTHACHRQPALQGTALQHREQFCTVGSMSSRLGGRGGSPL